MVDIFYKDGKPVPNPNPVNKDSPKQLSFHVDKGLKKMIDKTIIPRINKNDKDYVMLCDGYEGAGKSTLMMQIGKYVDPSLDLNRVCITAEEFKRAVIKADKGQCVIYDEAVTGLSAGESITRVGRLLKSLMMQMRQKNLFVIIILPSLFEFNKYAVLSRARSFFHVYEAKGRMGYWIGFNRKDMRMLYLKGKKTHSYTVRSRFRGRFYGKYTVNDEAYRKKKEEALMELDDTDGRSGESKMTYERKMYLVWVFDLLNRIIKLENPKKPLIKVTEPAFCELLSRHGVEMKRGTFATHKADVRKTGKTLIVDGLVV